jgi:ribosomal protein S18 acetylase RimI-like enzyme
VPNVEIRRIGKDEWQELRELRLRALIDAPDAFGSTRLRATTSNDDAIRLYERCGFLDNGDREPLREGSDVVTMSMTRSLG